MKWTQVFLVMFGKLTWNFTSVRGGRPQLKINLPLLSPLALNISLSPSFPKCSPLSLKASGGSGKANNYLQLERICFNFKTTQIKKQSSTIIVLIIKGLGLVLFFAYLFVSLFVLTWYLTHLYKSKTFVICAGGEQFKAIKKPHSGCDKVSELAATYSIWKTLLCNSSHWT